MAKALAYKRNTAQPVVIDTISGIVSNLGPAIAGAQTTSLFPARSTNLQTVHDGIPYMIGLTAAGTIEVRRYVASAWNVVAGPFTPPVGQSYVPLCIHLINDHICAIWTEVGGASDGVRFITSTDGTTWSTIVGANATINSAFAGHSIPFKAGIWFATPTGLWAINPLARRFTLAGVVGSYTSGETVTGSVSGTTAIARSFSGTTLRVDTVVGAGFVIGETLTGSSSGATSTISAIRLFEGAQPDQGNDLGLTGATGPANLLGCFASWDGRLYFVQPKTASGPTKLYQLNPTWTPTTELTAPLWTSQTFTGVSDAGFATVSNDAGLWSLFVNRNDELCLFYSGTTGTKLARTTSKAAPFTFTDLTSTALPAAISTRTNLGITLYADDRRRSKNLHWFLVRDASAGSTYLCSWDGSAAVSLDFSLAGSDYILPANRRGEETTWTNLAPAARITAVSQPFPGRVRIDYVVRCDPAHLVDVIPEYSIDGDQFFPMTEGDGDSGSTGLSASPAGTNYFFFWDAFADLDGDFPNLNMRIVARISGV